MTKQIEKANQIVSEISKYCAAEYDGVFEVSCKIWEKNGKCRIYGDARKYGYIEINSDGEFNNFRDTTGSALCRITLDLVKAGRI